MLIRSEFQVIDLDLSNFDSQVVRGISASAAGAGIRHSPVGRIRLWGKFYLNATLSASSQDDHASSSSNQPGCNSLNTDRTSG